MRAVDFPQKSGRCVEKRSTSAPRFFQNTCRFAAHLPSSLFPLHCSLFTLHFQTPRRFPALRVQTPCLIENFSKNNSRSKIRAAVLAEKEGFEPASQAPLRCPEPDLRRLCRLAAFRPLRCGLLPVSATGGGRTPHPRRFPALRVQIPRLIDSFAKNNSRSKNPSGCSGGEGGI